MKTILPLLFTVAVAGLLVSCGKSGSSDVQTPDPATQPEAQAALFQRTVDRVKAMIANKDFQGAQAALDAFKQYKLTPEQQKIVADLQALIPK
jgi:hypothetical protein